MRGGYFGDSALMQLQRLQCVTPQKPAVSGLGFYVDQTMQAARELRGPDRRLQLLKGKLPKLGVVMNDENDFIRAKEQVF
jgi:hypothetical protein